VQPRRSKNSGVGVGGSVGEKVIDGVAEALESFGVLLGVGGVGVEVPVGVEVEVFVHVSIVADGVLVCQVGVKRAIAVSVFRAFTRSASKVKSTVGVGVAVTVPFARDLQSKAATR